MTTSSGPTPMRSRRTGGEAVFPTVWPNFPTCRKTYYDEEEGATLTCNLRSLHVGECYDPLWDAFWEYDEVTGILVVHK